MNKQLNYYELNKLLINIKIKENIKNVKSKILERLRKIKRKFNNLNQEKYSINVNCSL